MALAMAMAIAFAGIAQATHHHKDALVGGTTDVHCLLCLFAAGSATAPVAMVQPAVLRSFSYHLPTSSSVPRSNDAASYDARGPPPV